MVVLLQVKSICLFLEYLALLLPSIPYFVHWPFDQVVCAGHEEEMKLAVLGIHKLGKKKKRLSLLLLSFL